MSNFDIVNYKVVNGIYSSKYNVIQELEKGGATVTNDEDYTAPQSIRLLSQRRVSFDKLFET